VFVFRTFRETPTGAPPVLAPAFGVVDTAAVTTPSTVVALAVLVAAGAGSTPAVRVRGVARHHHRYCAGGGAAVTEEDLRRVPPPVPLAGVEIAASPGPEIPGGEPVARVKTDTEGRFELRLRPGTWCLYLASREVQPRRKDAPLAVPPGGEEDASLPVGGPQGVVDFVDQRCLEAEQRRCDEVVEVGKKGAMVEFGTWESCPQPFSQPCWVGSQPP